MDNIDEFAALLLEEAKRYLELSHESPDDSGSAAHLHASMVLVFCAMEAHVNAVADEMALQSDLTVHEKSILLEREVHLDRGRFKLKKSLKIHRMEDRILFLFARFSQTPLDGNIAWWSNLKSAMQIRNRISHPKDATVITANDVETSILAVIAFLDALYRALYSRGLPAASRGLQSKLAF